MENHVMRPPFILLVLATVILGLGSGGQRQPTAAFATCFGAGKLPPPTFHDLETRTRYLALGDSGFALLDAGKTAEAITAFSEMEKVIPGGPWGNYNIACAYGRAGDIDSALSVLERAVRAGFDNTRAMRSDPDLASVLRHLDGLYLLEEAAEKGDMYLACLSAGLPAVQPLPVPADSLDAYVSGETRRIYDQASTWHPWQLRWAVIDLRARQLESLRIAKKDDPAFEYALGRLRALASVASIQERWGVLADGVQKEAEAYLAGNPTTAGRAEASYDLAVAAICREHPDPSSSAWATAAREARRWFDQVDTSSTQAGAAAAWQLALDLMEADHTKQHLPPEAQKLRPRIREFVSKHWVDSSAKAVANAFFAKDLIDAYWPIALNALDLDGKPVSLDQYRGKLLLIDFWATWCAPCRRELPGLREAYAKYHDRGLEILSVSFDFPRATPPATYRAWVAENGMNWRHVYDQKGFQGPLAGSFFIYSIPAAVLIGRDGSPVAMTDDLRGKKLAQTIERAL
jgi:thiol-disulfide isomerase/thioredoxin